MSLIQNKLAVLSQKCFDIEKYLSKHLADRSELFHKANSAKIVFGVFGYIGFKHVLFRFKLHFIEYYTLGEIIHKWH